MDHTVGEPLSELVRYITYVGKSLEITILMGVFYRVGESHEPSEQSPKWLFLR